jgi:hypothetical protein
MSKKEKTSQDKVEDGFKAAAILTDPVFCEAADALEEQWVDGWKKAKTTPEREQFWALVQALHGVRDALGVTKDRGEIEMLVTKRIAAR